MEIGMGIIFDITNSIDPQQTVVKTMWVHLRTVKMELAKGILLEKNLYMTMEKQIKRWA